MSNFFMGNYTYGSNTTIACPLILLLLINLKLTLTKSTPTLSLILLSSTYTYNHIDLRLPEKMPPADPSTCTTQHPTHDHEPSALDMSLLRMVVAEGVGTFVLVFCICGIIGNLHSMGIQTGLMEYATTAGLTVVVIIFSIGSISGAHINPAVTIAFAAAGPFPWCKVPLYVIAQVGGSVLATYAGKFVYDIKPELMLTTPLHHGWILALFVEFVATFIVLFLTTALFNNVQSLKQVSGFVAGGAICLGVLISGPVSGGSMNPARSLGPALVAWNFESLWIYLVGPTLGAIGGVVVYRFLRLQGWHCNVIYASIQGSHGSSLH